MPATVTLDDIRAAAAILRGVAVRTPLLPAPAVGPSIWLKHEPLQRGGAFKLRGAYNFIARLSPEERARGVIAPSSGNHAQAVALAAQIFGVPATAVMPVTVTPAKRAGVERLGARVELAGTTTRDRMVRALAIAAVEGQTLVPPYDHATIIAGQGTAGLEIVEDLPEVGTVVVPVGGGGLSSGVAAAVKLLKPAARVVGVEPAGAPKLSRALSAGEPVELDRVGSVADGLLAEIVTIDDAPIPRAMRLLLDRNKIVVEPSGAITVAALMEGAVKPRGPTVAVLSGGNVEWEDLKRLLG
jgi:threonine dehydratase